MANPQPILTPEQRLAREQREKYEKLGRYAAIGGVIVCPAIAFLPPRKLDLYTFALGISTYLSADYLANYYTRRGLIENIFAPRWPNEPEPTFSLPTSKARELHEENQRKLREIEIMNAQREGKPIPPAPDRRGVFEKVWMGRETEGWKEKRLAEERRALEEGKGYGGIILDQIWEVWNWGKEENEGEASVNTTSPDSAKDERKKP